jgi:hypothetical protein
MVLEWESDLNMTLTVNDGSHIYRSGRSIWATKRFWERMPRRTIVRTTTVIRAKLRWRVMVERLGWVEPMICVKARQSIALWVLEIDFEGSDESDASFDYMRFRRCHNVGTKGSGGMAMRRQKYGP